MPPSRRIIVTHQDQIDLTRDLTHENCDHYLAEPSAKNTANALTLAALEIQRLAEAQGVEAPLMISLHADALVSKLGVFHEALREMLRSAEKGRLTLLGITPEYAETGYGYIEKAASLGEHTHQVSSFREKPDAALAKEYVASGRFLWNSGIFAWSIETILAELESFVPASLQTLKTVLGKNQSFNSLDKTRMAEAYNSLSSIAIDPAVLEKSKKVSVVEADIGWKDVGSWDALDQCFESDAQGNLFYGNVIAIDSSGVTVDSDAQVVACIGIKDLVVVCSEGAILVCPKDRAQDVRRVVEELKKQGRSKLL